MQQMRDQKSDPFAEMCLGRSVQVGRNRGINAAQVKCVALEALQGWFHRSTSNQVADTLTTVSSQRNAFINPKDTNNSEICNQTHRIRYRSKIYIYLYMCQGYIWLSGGRSDLIENEYIYSPWPDEKL